MLLTPDPFSGLYYTHRPTTHTYISIHFHICHIYWKPWVHTNGSNSNPSIAIIPASSLYIFVTIFYRCEKSCSYFNMLTYSYVTQLWSRPYLPIHLAAPLALPKYWHLGLAHYCPLSPNANATPNPGTNTPVLGHCCCPLDPTRSDIQCPPSHHHHCPTQTTSSSLGLRHPQPGCSGSDALLTPAVPSTGMPLWSPTQGLTTMLGRWPRQTPSSCSLGSDTPC